MAAMNVTASAENGLLLDHWKMFEPLSMTVKIVLAMVLLVVLVVSAVGNTTVLVLFYKYKSLRTAPNSFVVNLTVADLSMCLLGVPVLASNCFRENNIRQFECFYEAFNAALTGFVSILSLAALAVDRSIVIGRRLPMTYPNDKPVISLVIIFTWVISGAGAALPFLGLGSYVLEGSRISCTFDYLTRSQNNIVYNITVQILFFVIPLIVIVSAYTMIYISVRSHERQYFRRRRNGNPSNEVALRRSTKSRKIEKHELKAARMGFILTCVFCVSWLPYSVICLVSLFGDPSNITPILVTVPGMFAKLSTILNPIFYIFLHKNFKRKLMLLYRQYRRNAANSFGCRRLSNAYFGVQFIQKRHTTAKY